MSIWSLVLLYCSVFSVQSADPYPWPSTLSDWNLYQAPIASLVPVEGILHYTVNAALYSDDAEKERFIRLPEGTSMQYRQTDAFEMPEGTLLIKNFFYPEDARNPQSGRTLLETRLIVKHLGQWHAVSYAWNAEQTEAFRSIAGGSKEIAWIDGKGRTQSFRYLIPDANQCKNCHNRNNSFVPLGITAKQLSTTEPGNQLLEWSKQGLLKGVQQDIHAIHLLQDYTDENIPLEQRARSYLDANCGHCHSAEGSARTSGLHLNIESSDAHALGVMKPPVAAGRGSGGLHYNIVPGKPTQSILLYRMQSSDPGIRMPEINRQIPHDEGIALISDWIKSLEEKD